MAKLRIVKNIIPMRRRGGEDSKKASKPTEQKEKRSPNDQQPTAAATWPERFAKGVAYNSTKYMESMLDETRLPRPRKQDFALLQRNEIQVGRKLGTGGFSHVHEIEDIHCTTQFRRNKAMRKMADCLEKRVREGATAKYAIKHLKPSLAQNAEDSMETVSMAAADLSIEAHFLSAMKDHPNICNLHGWSLGGLQSYSQKDGQRADAHFLILDRLYGTLQERIEMWRKQENAPNKMTKSERLVLLSKQMKISKQMASAIAYLHQRNVIFRDLKPENVGFDDNGNVKIFDFGLARELPVDDGENHNNSDDIFFMSGKVGTRRYMAPECALRLKYNLKADVYSWAIILYEMLSSSSTLGNNDPFADLEKKSDFETNVCVKGYRPPMQEEWSSAIKKLLESAWSKDIRKRPTMKSVCSQLERICADLDEQIQNMSHNDIPSSNAILLNSPSLQKEEQINSSHHHHHHHHHDSNSCSTSTSLSSSDSSINGQER